MIESIEEVVTAQIKDWGVSEEGISCILQMDVDVDCDEKANKNWRPYLKFMVISDTVEYFAAKPVWLDLFGSYTKYHKANHGFFWIVKATYVSGIKVSFVMIEGNDKNDVYKFSEINELEKSVKILVGKS